MFNKVLEYTGAYRKKTFLAIFLLVIAVAVNAVPFFFVYQLLSPLLGYGSIDTYGIVWRLVMILICVILHGVLYVKGLIHSHVAAFYTLENLRISLQKKMEKLPLGVIQEKGTGTIKKMFVEDIEALELLLAHALPEGFSNLVVPIITLAAMFFIDWKLGLFSLCALPLGIIAMMIMYASGMSKMGDFYSAAQKMNNTIIEYINGMEVVKIFNRDGESYHRFETDVKNYRDFTLDWYKVCWPWMAIYSSVIPCVSMFTLPVGAYLVIKGYSTLPDLVLVLCMSFSVGGPLLRALTFMSTIPQLNFKIQALEDIMNSDPIKQTSDNFRGRDYDITFNNVHFSYQEKEVLHGVSLEVTEGSMVALVGESGSGKSTLAKLLVHFYDIQEGTIKIGGQDITKMSLEALNKLISFVAQEQFLFNISILENIRLGKPEASDEEVLEAARKAQCMEFLNRLEKGIHTMAGDGGKQLSGGERQRISLARAILKDAPIIVLDEATAFIDPENEEKMNAAIAEIIKDKTVIVIAHKLHSIMNADKICVMQEGNLVQADTHHNLLQSCTEYQKLWEAANLSKDWKVSTKKEVQIC